MKKLSIILAGVLSLSTLAFAQERRESSTVMEFKKVPNGEWNKEREFKMPQGGKMYRHGREGFKRQENCPLCKKPLNSPSQKRNHRFNK